MDFFSNNPCVKIDEKEELVVSSSEKNVQYSEVI